ncbi:hypothetical protein Q8A73_020400 [Channa argus]|nr:hypothetical protein Q8A73_020400 [Channa argus]
MPDNMTGTTRSGRTTSIKKAEIATALMIGTIEDPTATQMRKEQYRQELLKQIAEQQRNKMREKNLVLSVAATGATNPEKEPDISYKPGIDLKARGRDPDPKSKDKPIENTEKGGPHGKSQVDYSTALSQLTGRTVSGSEIGAPRGVPSSDYFNQDYHRDFSNMLDVGIPRVAMFPPPIPPAISNIYQTPYDAAYYYYGSRNPLDPHLPCQQNGLPRVAEQPWNFHSPPQRPPPLRPSDLNEATDQHRESFLNVGETSADKTKQRSESYQEAIRQQIKEREQHKRREIEKKEQYNAKMEAEMMAYNPWGRSGGGAPIKDEQGNLLSDLNQMHRKNTLYRKEQPTSTKLQMQEKYTEDLKQQIEDNKKKKAKERERMRAEEEKEEKRLAEQSACMPWEYEEEQMKQKKTQEHSVSAPQSKTSIQVPASFDDQPIPVHLHMQERRKKEDQKEQYQQIEDNKKKKAEERDKMRAEEEKEEKRHRVDKQGWINKPKTHPQKAEKRERQEQETEIKIPENTKDREEKKRQQSPPIPTLQRKQTNMLVSSIASQVSPRTERSLSAPHCKTSLKDDEQEVLRQLSSLRRHLQKEKEESQMKIQRAPTDWGGNYHAPNRHRERRSGKAFEMVQKQSDHPPADRHYSGAARVNIQNIGEFNQLKYRDTASREEVLYMYPNPPTDAESLDIQQQALLREQQRKLRLMKREEHNFLEQQTNHYPKNKPGCFIHRDAMLPSETVFIDFYSGDACEELVLQPSTCGSSAEDQQGTAPGRKRDSDQVNQRERDIQPDPQEDRAQNRCRIRRQDSDTGEHKDRSEKLSDDEGDALIQHCALERNVSIETVATEPWLRPNTSHSLQRLSSRQRPRVRTGNLPFL